MTEWHSRLNYHTSAPPLPALAILGNAGMVVQKKKSSFIFGCSSSRTPKGWSLSAGTETETNEVCEIGICSFS